MPNLDSVTLRVTKRCNMNCSYCIVADDIDNKNTDEVYSASAIAEFLYEHPSIKVVSISGGEPLLSYPEVSRIILYLRSEFPELLIKVLTNGILIDNDFVELVNSNGVSVTVSIDGIASSEKSLMNLIDKSPLSDGVVDLIKQINRLSIKMIIPPCAPFANPLAAILKTFSKANVICTLDFTRLSEYKFKSVVEFTYEMNKLRGLPSDMKSRIVMVNFMNNHCGCDKAVTLFPDNSVEYFCDRHGIRGVESYKCTFLSHELGKDVYDLLCRMCYLGDRHFDGPK